MKSGGASRTAVFVCQGRAVADGLLAPASFSDPVARQLLNAAELDPVDQLRDGRSPSRASERFSAVALRACAELMVPRTVLIDRALTQALEQEPKLQVAVIGAGLDGRPWRLAALRGMRVYSIDHPASQNEMLDRSADLAQPLCDLQWVPIDLSTSTLGPGLMSVGHDPDRPTLWLWEGVIPYLDTSQVLATIQQISALSAGGSRLIAQYQAPSLAASLGRRASILLSRLARQQSMLADEPWKSTWQSAQMEQALGVHGWRVTADDSLLDYASTIDSPIGNSRSLASGRVLVAVR